MSTELRLYQDQWIDEASSYYYSLQLTDEKGVNLTSGQTTTVTLTWYELNSGSYAIVNSLNATDVKNANRGTLSATGLLELRFLPADTGILVATRLHEERRALIVWTFASGAKTKRHELDVVIRNLLKVP